MTEAHYHEEYANPDSLVTTHWLDAHREDANVAVVEVDVDTERYREGHVPGAVGWSWTDELNDPVRRDVVAAGDLRKLLERSGIDPGTTVVLYGDNHNWFAAFALWLLRYHGHGDVRLLDGGRDAWLAEDRPTTTEVPEPETTSYPRLQRRTELRATRDEVVAAVEEGNQAFIDVRSPQEFRGEILAPEGLDETAQRGGHVPGAVNVPWSEVLGEDGRFRRRKELEAIYREVLDEDVITYCRIGERSSHSWFVLHELLGKGTTRNYDGSWTEYGNLIGVPIETGARA